MSAEGKERGDNKQVFKYSSESEHAAKLLDDLKQRVYQNKEKVRFYLLTMYLLTFRYYKSGSGFSKLTSLVNVLIKFQMVMSQICQFFLSKTFLEAFAVQKLLPFFQQKI